MFHFALGLLLQASILSVAAASGTVSATEHGNAWKFGTGGGVIGFIVLIMDIIVFCMFEHRTCERLAY